MRSKRNKAILISLILTFIICAATHAANVWEVDSKGNICLNGEVFRVKGGSWFGLEGRHEQAKDPVNPSGAPMEMYFGNVFWNPSSNTLESVAKEIKGLGFNCVRLPVAPQTLDDSDPQGRDPNLKNTESVRIQGAFSALKATIKALEGAGLYILLDIHSCSNYVGWRAGRLDAKPPYVDANREEYEFTREDYSCSYGESQWLSDLKTLAGMGDYIMGVDIFNEPWDYSWEQWSSMIDKAYAAISSVNPNILIYAQGIGGSHGNQIGSMKKTPHGKEELNPNWGENLFEAGSKPPKMPRNKLVYSPHTYGPAVHVQKMFMDPSQPECKGLEAEEAGDKKCNVVINPEILEAGWDEHFGYLKEMGYAIAIGEFGGNMDWPNKAEARHQKRFGYLAGKGVDGQWQEAFVNYLKKRKIYDSFYWSINPESADTYGIFTMAYDPQSNPAGWGCWTGVDNKKLSMLKGLWSSPATEKGEMGVTEHPGSNTPILEEVNVAKATNKYISVSYLEKAISVRSTSAHAMSVKILDIAGKTMKAARIAPKATANIATSDLKPGCYVLQCNNGVEKTTQPLMLVNR